MMKRIIGSVFLALIFQLSYSMNHIQFCLMMPFIYHEKNGTKKREKKDKIIESWMKSKMKRDDEKKKKSSI